jgi:hypothetical protein
MNKIVETLQESQSLIESWGDVIDVTEFMTDTPGFFQANSLGVYTQIYDRADGRYRPVYTNESDLKIIRAMGWLLVERVPMAQAWINRLLDYTIGTGFDWTIKASDKRLEKAIQAYVRETLDNSKWSSELERESYAREVGEGECLIEHVYENGQCLAIVCEADELTEPAAKNELEDWIGIDYVPSWSFGVLTRENRPQNPIGYHFVRNATGTDWDYVTADRVSHWKRNVRSRAKRGFSDFYKPHLYLLRADRVLTNTAEGAATQAAIAYIVEHKDSQQRQAENIIKRFSAPTGRVDPMTGIMERKRKMKPGTRLDVPEGQTYKAGLLGANNSGIYIEVMEAALRLAGSVHAFVEGMLTGSYSNNNFASALVAEGPFMQGRLAEQSQRKERMREMILKMIRLGAGKRRFAAVGYESWDSIRDAITVEVIPSRIVPMDPLKTAQALAIQKQNGWVSDKTCINELGRDPDTETANGLKIGGAENQPGAGGQPEAETNEKTGAAVSDLGNVSKTEQEQGGEWLGITTVQWRRNRKAITDVLTDFARGKLKRNVAKVLLRSIGIPDRGIETILDDASDGQIDSMPQMESLTEAERKTLNKPFRTSGGPKKFSVYVKNQKGNVVKVNFGDPKMRIKRDDPGSRRGFRARHNCQDPGPKWKARYWSCRMWSKPSVTKILKESLETGEIGWDGRTFVRESWLYRQNPRLLEVRDGDGDGKINDGKPSEAPAEKKDKKQNGELRQIPKVEISEEVKQNLLRSGHSPFSGEGLLAKELRRAGASDEGIKQFEQLVDAHRHGGDSQTYADKQFAENLRMDNDLGSAIRANIAIQEATIEAWNQGLGQQYLNKLAKNAMRDVEWRHKNGYIDTEEYPTPQAYFDARVSNEYKFEPMRFYRKGGEKDVMPTSTNAEGGQAHTVVGTGSQPKFTPDRSWSYDELQAKGYRVLGGFGQQFGYSGEAEITWIKAGESKKESFQEAKDGDGDGLIDDGKPTQRPAPPKEKKAYGKKSPGLKDAAALSLMSFSELEKFERSVRMNRIRMKSEDYVTQMKDVALTRWQKHKEHPEYVRLTGLMERAAAGETFDEVQGSGMSASEYFSSKRAEFKLSASEEFFKANRAKHIAEHAKGVRNALKDKREVPDDILREYLQSDWMPKDIRDRLLGSSEKDAEPPKPDKEPKKEVKGKEDEGLKIEKAKPALQNETQERFYRREIDSFTTAESQNEARQRIKTLANDSEIGGLSKKMGAIGGARQAEAKKLQTEREDLVWKARAERDEDQSVIEKMIESNAPESEIKAKEAQKRQSYQEKINAAFIVFEKKKRDLKEKGLKDIVAELSVPEDQRLDLSTKVSFKKQKRKTQSGADVSAEEMNQRVDEAREMISKITAKRPGLASAEVQIEIDPKNKRAFYSLARKTVVVGPTSGVSTIAHEIGHALEIQEQGQTTRSKSWLAVANEGGTVKTIGSNSKRIGVRSEVYYANKNLAEHAQYARKLYNSEATELVSQGFSRLIDDPAELVADDAHFRFFMGWLKGK